MGQCKWNKRGRAATSREETLGVKLNVIFYYSVMDSWSWSDVQHAEEEEHRLSDELKARDLSRYEARPISTCSGNQDPRLLYTMNALTFACGQCGQSR
jgi:hypothetical protein